MGNRAFGNVFPKVHQALKGNQSIKEIMLAAPDVDAKVFKNEIAPYLKFSNCCCTVYSSGKDKALWGSWLAHGFARRAGQRVVGLEGLESIDAGTINTSKLGLGHSYYGENKGKAIESTIEETFARTFWGKISDLLSDYRN